MQLIEWEENGTTQSKQCSWLPLIAALTTYLKNYDAWSQSSAWEEMKNYWCCQVGGEQCVLPAHVVQEYCHANRSFLPCPDFKIAERSESLATKIGDWCSSSYNGGKLGEKFAYIRGSKPHGTMVTWMYGQATLFTGWG